MRRYSSTKLCSAMVRRLGIFGRFLRLHFQRAACSTFQTCILNSHNGHTMCRRVVDIQFQHATAEIRRGKKGRKKKGRRRKDWPIRSRTCKMHIHGYRFTLTKDYFFSSTFQSALQTYCWSGDVKVIRLVKIPAAEIPTVSQIGRPLEYAAYY